MANKVKITYQGGPSGDTVIEADRGDTILETAIIHDVPLHHACGGFCACTTCHVKVLSGAEHLSPMDEEERDRLDSTADEVAPNSRLGCQARIMGDCVVQMVNTD